MKHAAILIATVALLASCNPNGSTPPHAGRCDHAGKHPGQHEAHGRH